MSVVSAQSLEVQQQAKEILQQVYGYPEFRAQQLDVIEATIRGQDSLVLMPTGGGKSICYQIPALLRPGVTLVISPLIALMHDQVTALKQIGVNAAYLNSSLSADQQRSIVDALEAGQLDLLYVAPERLVQPNMLRQLATAAIGLIAIDEAH